MRTNNEALMQYTRKLIDLDTGEKKWIELGDHQTLTEVAHDLAIGERHFRTVLLHMGILQREWDERSRQFRNRLTPGAVQSGFGIRHDNKGFHSDPDRSPFDVLSPEGVEFVKDHLRASLDAVGALPADAREAFAALSKADERRLSETTPEMRVCWLDQHYPGLAASIVAKGLGVSATVVHRYRERRQDQLRRAERALATTPVRMLDEAPHCALATAGVAELDLHGVHSAYSDL
ncbi:MAG: hypothetical protein U1E21_04440 [Reyranellaceae bacterium]